MDWQPFINVGLLAAAGISGWVLRTFYGDIRALEASVASHKTHVAENYATNADLAGLNGKLDEILRYLRK